MISMKIGYLFVYTVQYLDTCYDIFFQWRRRSILSRNPLWQKSSINFNWWQQIFRRLSLETFYWCRLQPTNQCDQMPKVGQKAAQKAATAVFTWKVLFFKIAQKVTVHLANVVRIIWSHCRQPTTTCANSSSSDRVKICNFWHARDGALKYLFQCDQIWRNFATLAEF